MTISGSSLAKYTNPANLLSLKKFANCLTRYLQPLTTPLTMPKASKADRATGLITISRVIKTPAQTAWLAERLPEFATAQTEGKLLEFWPKIHAEYLAAFPVPGMDDDSLPQEERDKVAETVHRVREARLILFLILYGSISYGSNDIYISFNRASIGGLTTKVAIASAVREIPPSTSKSISFLDSAILRSPRILAPLPNRTVIAQTIAVATRRR